MWGRASSKMDRSIDGFIAQWDVLSGNGAELERVRYQKHTPKGTFFPWTLRPISFSFISVPLPSPTLSSLTTLPPSAALIHHMPWCFSTPVRHKVVGHLTESQQTFLLHVHFLGYFVKTLINTLSMWLTLVFSPWEDCTDAMCVQVPRGCRKETANMTTLCMVKVFVVDMRERTVRGSGRVQNTEKKKPTEQGNELLNYSDAILWMCS